MQHYSWIKNKSTQLLWKQTQTEHKSIKYKNIKNTQYTRTSQKHLKINTIQPYLTISQTEWMLYFCICIVFTALHGMQTRSSDKISAVRPSVKRLYCNKTKDHIPRERSFSLVFWEKKWFVGATTSTWNFGSTGPRWSEIADFQPIIARSASAVRPSEKRSINTNRKSTTRFPRSPRWTSYVVPKPPNGGSKTQSGQNLNNKLRYLRNDTILGWPWTA